MTVSKMIEKLECIQSCGGGELELIYSTDDEGNEYNKVCFEPTKFFVLDPENSRDLSVIGMEDVDGENVDISNTTIMVCIN